MAVCVFSSAVAGQPEVDRNQAEHPVRVLPLTCRPAASHLPLQTPGQLLQGPTGGRKPTCTEHVSATHTVTPQRTYYSVELTGPLTQQPYWNEIVGLMLVIPKELNKVLVKHGQGAVHSFI